MPGVRTVKKIFQARPTLEGAGVHLHRAFAQRDVPMFDPFLMLDDFGSANPDDYMKGFPWHPHRGIETVTYMLEGEVEHADSLGNKGVIKKGEVQWMTAGSGVIHQEMPHESHPTLRGMQLWVNLPKAHKMTAPKYRSIEAKDIPVVEENGTSTRIIAGTYRDMSGPVRDLVVPVNYFSVRLIPGALFSYETPENYTAFVYVYEGSIIIGDQTGIQARATALTNPGSALMVQAGADGALCMIGTGKPIGELVAWAGSIVMNTRPELEKAFSEYRNGTFVASAPPSSPSN